MLKTMFDENLGCVSRVIVKGEGEQEKLREERGVPRFLPFFFLALPSLFTITPATQPNENQTSFNIIQHGGQTCTTCWIQQRWTIYSCCINMLHPFSRALITLVLVLRHSIKNQFENVLFASGSLAAAAIRLVSS